MKPPKPKICLIDVSEPLTVFCGLRARCGKVFENAEAKFFADDDIVLQAELAIRYLRDVCKDCRELPADRLPDERYYMYGLVEKSSGVKSPRKEDSGLMP